MAADRWKPYIFITTRRPTAMQAQVSETSGSAQCPAASQIGGSPINFIAYVRVDRLLA